MIKRTEQPNTPPLGQSPLIRKSKIFKKGAQPWTDLPSLEVSGYESLAHILSCSTRFPTDHQNNNNSSNLIVGVQLSFFNLCGKPSIL